MKPLRQILLKTACILLIHTVAVKAYSQTGRQIDTSRFVKVDTSPLTVREGKGLNIPLPPNGHPRIFFRKDDITALKTKMEHPLLRECRDKVYESAAWTTDGKLITENTEHNFDKQILDAIEAKAFLYALTGNQTKGVEAVDCIFNLNNTLIINYKKQDVCRDIGRVILTTALVYDWCYDLISAREQKSLIAIMESLATKMEIKWPRLVQPSVTGHGVEAQVARDMLCCGIAVYDEKPDIYMRAAGRIFAEIIPAQNYNYLSGHHHQGTSYGPYRFLWEMYTTLIYDRMGYPGITNKLQGKMPYYWLYMRRPDGQLLRDGNDSSDKYMTFGAYWSFHSILYAASYYKDPYLMGEAIKEKLIGGEPLFDLLLIAPDVPEKHVSSLPLTRYFPAPYGGMVARTSWDEGMEANTVVVAMKIAEYNFLNHQHLDAGSFQIYHKGPLAIQSGIYEGGEGGYGCEHHRNYYIRTIAHNCMLVYDPDEKVIWNHRPINLSNDGGQRIPAGKAELTTMDDLSDEHRNGKVLAHGFGPDTLKPGYSYLKGDITQAYASKVKRYRRSFVFLNMDDKNIPAAFIVYDHITSSNKDFKKTWLLHSVQEPVFNGNTVEIVRNEKGYNGKLVNTTLLPVSGNLQINKTGGKGNEYNVNGVNYPQFLVLENNSGDGAAWRTEISSEKPAETDIFLNVMQVMDAATKQPLEIKHIDNERFTGVKLANRIVLFSKEGNDENQAIKLNIKGKGKFKILIADLENGEWKISGGNKSMKISSRNKYLYFEVTSGKYYISKKQDNS